MVYFRPTMGGFEVFVNGKRFGYIQKPYDYGFFTSQTCIVDHIRIDPRDLREIADKVEEILRPPIIFKVVRASCGYATLVVESMGKRHKYYVSRDDLETAQFKEVNEKEALLYFSGQADGMGFGELPRQDFVSLKEVEDWANTTRTKFLKERLLEIWNDENTWNQKKDNPYELMDFLMEDQPLTEEDFKNGLEKHGLVEKWPEFQKRYGGKFKPPS